MLTCSSQAIPRRLFRLRSSSREIRQLGEIITPALGGKKPTKERLAYKGIPKGLKFLPGETEIRHFERPKPFANRKTRRTYHAIPVDPGFPILQWYWREASIDDDVVLELLSEDSDGGIERLRNASTSEDD